MADEIIIETTSVEVIEVGVPGPQGPAGAAGTGLETLTTQGDTLYRGASTGERLPIGTTGQVLKVSAQGIPAWANESGAVTSVNGETGAVTLDAADVGAAATNHSHQPGAIYCDAVDVADTTLSSGEPNGIYFRNGSDNSKAIYKSAQGYAIWWDDGEEEWVLGNGPQTAKYYIGTGDTTYPWEATSWALGPQGSGETPVVDQALLSNFQRNAAQDAVSTRTPKTGNASSTEVVLGSDTRLTNARTPTAHTHTVSDITNFPAIPTASTATPSALGVAAAGTATAYAREDHVHAMPSASDVGAAPATNIEQTAINSELGNNDLSEDIDYINGIVSGLGTAATSDTTDFAAATHAASHAASGSDPVFNQDLNTSDNVTFNEVTTDNNLIVGGDLTINNALVVGTNGVLFQSTTSNTTLTTLATAQRVVSLPDASGTIALAGDAPASHAHGNLTADGKVGSTSGLPVVTTTAGAVTTLALGTAGQILRTKSDLSGVEFADPAASGVTSVTGTAPIVSSGGTTPAISVTVGTTANTVAAGDDSRITGAIQSTLVDAKGDLIVATAADTVARLPVGATNGHVLTVDSAEAGGMKWAAASGGVSAVGASTADVLSVSGSELVADDGGTIDSSDPFIKWDDAAGKLVYANPLRRTSSGAFYVGIAPTTTALGTNAVNVQSARNIVTQVASALNTTCVGQSTRASAEGATSIGNTSASTAFYATSIGQECAASGEDSIAIGGYLAQATANNAIAIGRQTTANLRAMFSTRAFNAVYWGGQTTSDTANVELNLDATATNRMTIAANTAVIADISLIARRTDNTKFLAARRWVAIRRDGSNNTALIGAVQTIGTDQSEGSPTWTFTIDADDTASVESLRVRVTGAAAETVNWRVMALYRVVA